MTKEIYEVPEIEILYFKSEDAIELVQASYNTDFDFSNGHATEH